MLLFKLIQHRSSPMKSDQKATVASREILHDGIKFGTVIEVAVPKEAKRKTFPGGAEGENTYLHFMQNVKDGMVNLHVRSSDELQGQTIRAHIQVVQKVMSDGREFVYIDIFPTDAPVTHWWHIIGSDKEPLSEWSSYGTDSIAVAFTTVGDKRWPKERPIVLHADALPNNSPFAVLAGLK